MRQMIVVSLIRFSEPITFSSLFPYVYFMIRDFGIAKDPSDISRYTGMIAASFSFAQFLFCIHWGRLSDRIGRKPVLLIGLVGTAATMIMFGFAKNFYTALAARTCAGALNGNIAVLQTVVGESVTERRHQGLAFATLPLLWNLGTVVGPLIGGSKFLTRPKSHRDTTIFSSSLESLQEKSFSEWHNDFLSAHPYALSNILVAAALLFSALCGFLFLEETQPQNKQKYDVGLALGDSLLSRLCFKVRERPWDSARNDLEEDVTTKDAGKVSNDQSGRDEPHEQSPLLDRQESSPESSDDESGASSINSGQFLSERASNAIARRYLLTFSLHSVTLGMPTGPTVSGFFEALGNREIFTYRVIGTMLCYFSIAFHALVYSEFVPVFLAASFKIDQLSFPWRIQGGMNWTSEDIGTMLSSIGLVGCLLILFVFPFLDRHVRTISTYRFACAVFPIAYFLLPYNIFLTKEYNHQLPQWLHTVTVYGCSVLATFANSLAFPQVAILVFRVTKPEQRALVNSTSMSLNSLARFIAPLTWGALTSFCDARSLAQVPWSLLTGIAIIGLVLSFKIDDYDEDLED